MSKKEWADELNEILEDYQGEVIEKLDIAALTTAKNAVKELKEKSPKSRGAKSGEYAKSWGYKKEKMPFGYTSYTIHNKKHYRLTHLLENGHMIKNKYGSYGRTRPIPHIKPVELIVQDEFVKEAIEKLKEI